MDVAKIRTRSEPPGQWKETEENGTTNEESQLKIKKNLYILYLGTNWKTSEDCFVENKRKGCRKSLNLSHKFPINFSQCFVFINTKFPESHRSASKSHQHFSILHVFVITKKNKNHVLAATAACWFLTPQKWTHRRVETFHLNLLPSSGNFYFKCKEKNLLGESQASCSHSLMEKKCKEINFSFRKNSQLSSCSTHANVCFLNLTSYFS